MLSWTKPGPLVLIGFLGLRLPIITRGVLPREINPFIQLLSVFRLFLLEYS